MACQEVEGMGMLVKLISSDQLGQVYFNIVRGKVPDSILGRFPKDFDDQLCSNTREEGYRGGTRGSPVAVT